jgi:hypothetical protein
MERSHEPARHHRIAVLFRRYARAVTFDVPDAGTVTATVRLAAGAGMIVRCV